MPTPARAEHAGSPRGAFAAAVAIALLALCPDIVLSTAFTPLTASVAGDLGASGTWVQVAAGLANAGYAIGAVVGAALALRFVASRLFLTSAVLFVVGALLCALAPEIVGFTAGRVLQGLATGGLLVSALPFLLTHFGLRHLATAAAVVNVGLFGASALGPMVGGLTAEHWQWRGLFYVAAAVTACSVPLATVYFPTFDAPDPDRPVDLVALGVVVVSTVATFTATSLLAGQPFVSWPVLPALVVGLLTLVLLLLVEARRKDPLVPLGALATQLPVTGLVAAMVGGAVFVAAAELLQTELTMLAGRSPSSAGLLFWPAVVGVLIAAVALRVLFPTRFLPLLVDAGLACLAAACGLMLAFGVDPPTWGVLVITLLLGLGAGSTVSPGIFLVALGLPAALLGRALAMVQLLRSVAAYAVAPVLLYVAMSATDPADGVHTAVLVALILAGLGLSAALVLPAVSGARLRVPDLAGWLDGEQALPSPTTGVLLVPGAEDDDAEPLLPASWVAPDDAEQGRHRRRPRPHR